MMSEDKEIVKRLDTIIRLLLNQQTNNGKMKLDEQYLLMDSIGLNSTEIGKFLKKEPRNVSSRIIKLKKKTKIKSK